MTSKLRAQCPKCQGVLQYHAGRAGEVLNCPVCREVIELPGDSPPPPAAQAPLPRIVDVRDPDGQWSRRIGFAEALSYICLVGWIPCAVASSFFAFSARESAEVLGRQPDAEAIELAGSLGWLAVLMFLAGLALRIEVAIRQSHLYRFPDDMG